MLAWVRNLLKCKRCVRLDRLYDLDTRLLHNCGARERLLERQVRQLEHQVKDLTDRSAWLQHKVDAYWAFRDKMALQVNPEVIDTIGV